MGISKKHRRKRSTKCVRVKYNKKTCKKTNKKKTNRKKTNKKRQIGAGACQGKQCVPGKPHSSRYGQGSERRERERQYAQQQARQRAEQEQARQRAAQEKARQRAAQEKARQREEQEQARERAAAAYAKIKAEDPTYRKMQQDFDDALNEERIKSEKKGEFAFEKFHQKKDAVVDLWERAISSQRELADKGVFMPFTKSLHEEMQKDPETARLATAPLSRTSSPVLSRTSSLESCEEAGNCPIMG